MTPQIAPQITINLLNYRRPANIPVILDSIRRQTIKPVVFLWNNGPDDVNFPGVDRYEKSGENEGCMVRWKMAIQATTPYVMSLDDDLCFARDDALANIIESIREMNDPARIIGPAGCCFDNNSSYAQRRDVYAGYARLNVDQRAMPASGYEAVDMIKGRAMAIRREQLDGLVFSNEREDDIFLSAALAGGRRRFHRVPMRLQYAFRELPELGVGNWKMSGHLNSRDRATAEYFCPKLPQLEQGEVSGSWRPRRLGTIHERDGNQLLIRLAEGAGVQLNPTAALIWQLCDGSHTENELLVELSDLFDAPKNLLRHDLGEALNGLLNNGALEPNKTMAARPCKPKV